MFPTTVQHNVFGLLSVRINVVYITIKNTPLRESKVALILCSGGGGGGASNIIGCKCLYITNHTIRDVLRG